MSDFVAKSINVKYRHQSIRQPQLPALQRNRICAPRAFGGCWVMLWIVGTVCAYVCVYIYIYVDVDVYVFKTITLIRMYSNSIYIQLYISYILHMMRSETVLVRRCVKAACALVSLYEGTGSNH